jgi:4-oxalocrotonate tautomerase
MVKIHLSRYHAGARMPYINLQITKDGVTREQKKQIVEEFTATLVNTLGKKPEHIHIVIEEVDPDNWGFAGQLTTDWRKNLG